MYVQSLSRFGCRLMAVLMLLLGSPLAANAQSAPPGPPSASLYIHQVQVAFIGSGEMGLRRNRPARPRVSACSVVIKIGQEP